MTRRLREVVIAMMPEVTPRFHTGTRSAKVALSADNEPLKAPWTMHHPTSTTHTPGAIPMSPCYTVERCRRTAT